MFMISHGHDAIALDIAAVLVLAGVFIFLRCRLSDSGALAVERRGSSRNLPALRRRVCERTADRRPADDPAPALVRLMVFPLGMYGAATFIGLLHHLAVNLRTRNPT